jgi:hypothetical protein
VITIAPQACIARVRLLATERSTSPASDKAVTILMGYCIGYIAERI